MRQLTLLAALILLGCGRNNDVASPQNEMEKLADLQRELEIQRAPMTLDEDDKTEKTGDTSGGNLGDAFNQERSRLEGIYDDEYERLGGRKKVENDSGGVRGESARQKLSADQVLRQIRIGTPKQIVIDRLGKPDASTPIGQGEAWVYYTSATESVFMTLDKRGNVFSINKQRREE